MIKFLKILKGESGQTLVIAALFMVVLIGCAAIVVDYGMVASEKSDLQNAADAAALAGAQALPDETLAETTAENMALQYGVDAEVSFPEAGASQQIQVTCSTTASYSFARIFGNNSQNLAATAVAEKTTSGLGGGMEAFDNALFSGSESGTITFNGSSMNITGNIHSNYRFAMNGSSQMIDGSLTAVNRIRGNGSSITITGLCQAPNIKFNGSSINVPNEVVAPVAVIDMPDFSDTIYAQALAAGEVYTGNKSFNGSKMTINSSIYVDGNITFNGSDFDGTGFIFATGNISFNGSSLNFSSTDSVGFYSGTGNITINGSSAEVEGVLFAPEGYVRFNGSSQTVHGRIVANTIDFNGSNQTIIAGSNDLNCLASEESIRLIG